MSAQMTAKMVIASAKRLMAVRHFCRKRKRIARDQRAGVADADPEHEVHDGEAPATGWFRPQMPVPSQMSHADGAEDGEAEEREANEASHPFEGGASTTRQTASVTEWKV
jgi:hypothetical protein